MTNTAPDQPFNSIPAPELERRILFKVKLFLFIYIAVGNFVWNLDRNNIGFAQLVIGRELAIKATLFGFAAGIIAISSFLMQVPAGLLFDKLGAKRWMTFTMTAWGVASIAQAFIANGTQLVILRFILGLFEAGFTPGIYCLITRWLRDKNYGQAASMIYFGVGFSGILGGPFAGWVLGRQFFGLSGWRSLFLLEGAFTVVWALTSMYFLNDDPGKTPWLNPGERDFMVNYIKESDTEKSRKGAVEKLNLWQTLKNPRIAALTLSNTLYAGLAATLFFFMPTLLKTAGRGVSNQYVGLLVAGPYLVQMVVGIFWGAHADKHNERHWHTVLPLLVAAGGMLLFPLAKQPLVAMLSLCMALAGNSGFNPNFWATCNLMAGRDTIAKSTALIQAGGQLGIFAAPILFGLTIDATGHSSLGAYLCVGVYLVNFAMMNVFFFRYKAQQKALAAAA